MERRLFVMKLMLAIVAILVLASAQSTAQEKMRLYSYKDTVSYVVGMNVATTLLKQNIMANYKVLATGIADVVDKKQMRIGDIAMGEALTRMQERMTYYNANPIEDRDVAAADIFGRLNVGNDGSEIANYSDSLSYSLGVNVGRSLIERGSELHSRPLVGGFLHVMTDEKPVLTEDDVLEVMFVLQQQQVARLNAMSEKNIEAGQQFLEENTQKKGVVTLASGLQYTVVKEGRGESPSINDEVLVHYHGVLLDGSVFDSSVERGEPLPLRVSQVIKGWTEALQLMKVGSKWRLFIPPDLAYGDKGAGSAIPPHATLIFDVELLAINE